MREEARLSLRELVVRSPSGRVLVTAERLTIEPGSAIGVRGPSGAGKSTLLYALAGLQTDVSGSIFWGEQDLVPLSDAERARFRRTHIGMIFQDFLLFEELSALQNAALGAAFGVSSGRRTIKARAAEMLQRLRVPAESRSVDSFSGGERQRVAVARALANDPAIILADEPTASLDRIAADLLIEDLIRLVRDAGKTLIAVSHDLKLLSRMDLVLDVIDGRLRTEAPHA